MTGLVFEAAGIISHNVVKLPENSVNIAGYGLDLSGLNGFEAQSRANLVNAMIKAETSVFANEVVPALLSSPGQTAYSIVSGDPMPFTVAASVNLNGISFASTYTGDSSFLTDSATGLAVGTFTSGNLAYQTATGNLNPGSLLLSGATIANLGSNLIESNAGLLSHIESNYGLSGGIQVAPDGQIIFAEGSWNLTDDLADPTGNYAK